ncbi:MAG: copper chaperone [Moorea sp. SIO3H5]|nr:copper chaperone [Moorena sp. SIO3H5]
MWTRRFKAGRRSRNPCLFKAGSVNEGILQQEPDSKVTVDVTSKTVRVETEASEESIRQIITTVGHTVE